MNTPPKAAERLWHRGSEQRLAEYPCTLVITSNPWQLAREHVAQVILRTARQRNQAIQLLAKRKAQKRDTRRGAKPQSSVIKQWGQSKSSTKKKKKDQEKTKKKDTYYCI